jgi:hypothetical protein
MGEPKVQRLKHFRPPGQLDSLFKAGSFRMVFQYKKRVTAQLKPPPRSGAW